MLLPGRECVKCGCAEWDYPPRPSAGGPVKVTCGGCGRYIANYDYDRMPPLERKAKKQTNAPEEQGMAGRSQKENLSQGRIDFDEHDGPSVADEDPGMLG